MENPDVNLLSKARKIKLVIFDVDGVLTDGRIIMGPDGGEYKSFNCQDGHRLRIMAERTDIKVVLLTGRESEIVARRAAELNIEEVYQGAKQKLPIYESILERHQLKDEEVAYLGDDLVDIPVMRKVGFPVAVADAAEEVINIACWTTKAGGGRGAAKELVEYLLKAQDKWEAVIARYFVDSDNS